jgi:endogenous inhibitor of DNA gyrase (YacG/DUF329 family)
MLQKVCALCGKPFESHAKKAKFCSRNCKRKYYAAYGEQKEPKEFLTLTCPVCGLEFKQNSHKQVFCSKACYQAGYHSERDTSEAIRRTEKAWHSRAIMGLDITESCTVNGYPFCDPQCTPMEGLRWLSL